jgi:transcriptional regulator with XRE-family HTH domain
MDLEREVGLKFSRRLRALRKGSALTQEQLAERAEVSVKHIQRLEGKTPCGVRLVTLYRLARALDLGLGRLLDFK